MRTALYHCFGSCNSSDFSLPHSSQRNVETSDILFLRPIGPPDHPLRIPLPRCPAFRKSPFQPFHRVRVHRVTNLPPDITGHIGGVAAEPIVRLYQDATRSEEHTSE